MLQKLNKELKEALPDLQDLVGRQIYYFIDLNRHALNELGGILGRIKLLLVLVFQLSNLSLLILVYLFKNIPKFLYKSLLHFAWEVGFLDL